MGLHDRAQGEAPAEPDRELSAMASGRTRLGRSLALPAMASHVHATPRAARVGWRVRNGARAMASLAWSVWQVFPPSTARTAPASSVGATWPCVIFAPNGRCATASNWRQHGYRMPDFPVGSSAAGAGRLGLRPQSAAGGTAFDCAEPVELEGLHQSKAVAHSYQ